MQQILLFVDFKKLYLLITCTVTLFCLYIKGTTFFNVRPLTQSATSYDIQNVIIFHAFQEQWVKNGKNKLLNK